MAVYFVTGKLGSGKTLSTVGKIRDYLEQGRRVATNLDLNLGKMMPSTSKQTVIRLPDKPRIQDMVMLGQGCVEEDESRYGCIVLDELATWFNSRNWRDPSRLQLIDWFLHSRKHHWDIYFIVQDIESLDGQLINALCEHLVVCSRTDRLTIPFIGPMIKSLGITKVLPKVHLASVYYGMNKTALRVDRWWYRARDLYAAYDTAQRFRDGEEIIGGQVVDMRASYSILSAYHTTHQALIAYHRRQIVQLQGKGSEKTRPASAGGSFSLTSPRNLKSLAIALTCVTVSACVMISRANRDEAPPAQAAPAVSIAPTPAVDAKPEAAPVSQADPLPATPAEPAKPEKDRFEELTDGSVLKFESLISDEIGLRGKIRILRGTDITVTSLDDARQLGYVIEDRITHVKISNTHYAVTIPKR